ncbi:hypothetical protein B0H19DRAFT_1055170 [Mycena capillaripes]|nr:hypothetical protein B0H19DRAFT_1055170 [Mycena capillaripes]
MSSSAIISRTSPKLSLSVPSTASEWAIRHYVAHSFYLSRIWMFQEGESTLQRECWEDWSQLTLLPALTHLCLSQKFPSDILSQAGTECPRLLLGVAAFWSTRGRDDAIVFSQSLRTADPRIVVMVVRDYKADWQAGAQGGDDFWAPAILWTNQARQTTR